MEQLTILVDMDDTIENLCEPWVEYLNDRYGTTVTTNDITSWDIAKIFPTLTKTQVFAPLMEEALWERVKPLPKAYDNIYKLKNNGHKVLIVTTSVPLSIPIKLEKVLFKYFPFFTYNDVIITSHKQLIRGDILVDDAPHNLKGGLYKKILMTAPHNRYFDEESIGALRAYDWDVAYNLITQYAHRKDIHYE